MENLFLISGNQIDELTQKVFTQSLSDTEHSSSFTDVLAEEEEHAIVTKILQNDEGEKWQAFLLEYQKHYSLFPSVAQVFYAQPEHPLFRALLLQDLETGFNRDQGQLFCAFYSKKEEKDDELLRLFASKGKHFYSSVLQALENIDPYYAELYKEAVGKQGYPSSSNARKNETNSDSTEN